MGDHKAWISPGVRTVEWTETAEVAIGHHECMWCRVPTPSPTDEKVVEFAQDHRGASTMWPFNGWTPSGWTNSDHVTLCPECSESRDRAVARAKGLRTP